MGGRATFVRSVDNAHACNMYMRANSRRRLSTSSIERAPQLTNLAFEKPVNKPAGTRSVPGPSTSLSNHQDSCAAACLQAATAKVHPCTKGCLPSSIGKVLYSRPMPRKGPFEGNKTRGASGSSPSVRTGRKPALGHTSRPWNIQPSHHSLAILHPQE